MSTHIPGPKVDHIGVHDRILSGQERGPSRHELLTYLYDLENEHVTAPSSAVLKKKNCWTNSYPNDCRNTLFDRCLLYTFRGKCTQR